jgi:tyrosine phenol-lyase
MGRYQSCRDPGGGLRRAGLSRPQAAGAHFGGRKYGDARGSCIAMRTIIEPFRIHTVEPIRVTTEPEREQLLRAAHFNLFGLRAKDVMIDLLTDSGTGAMSTLQWAAIMTGDESYAGCESFYELEQVVRDMTGKRHVFPVHQGRAAERIAFGTLAKAGDFVPNNTHFDTTRANLEQLGVTAVDLLPPEGLDPRAELPFKGDMDLRALERFLREHAGRVPFGMLTITNNSNGGQPVSLANLRATSRLYRSHDVPFLLDAARFAENAYLIQQREPDQRGRPLAEIVREIFSLADGCLISAKKDGLVNIGGLLAVDDAELAERMRDQLILTEGFPTYGGLAGRDLAALAQGLREVLDPEYLAYRLAAAQYLASRLEALGVATVRPAGMHAVYVDARAFLPQIPPHELPGQALCCELYRIGGIRAVEIGTLMFGRTDAKTGKPTAAKMDLVRLTLPRRTYTQSHFDWVIESFERLVERKSALKGLRIVKEPPFLRGFTARLAPL